MNKAVFDSGTWLERKVLWSRVNWLWCSWQIMTDGGESSGEDRGSLMVVLVVFGLVIVTD